MNDSSAFLSCLQLSDTFFPSGLYTLSYGLETAVQLEQVDASSFGPLLLDYLRASFGPTDGIALACAHRASADGHLQLALEADSRLTAVKLAREARETSCRVGHQLLNIGRQIFAAQILDRYARYVDKGAAPGNHAVVLGLLMAALGIAREKAVLSELYAFSASFVSAGVRLNVIDYRMAQAILHQNRAETVEIAQVNSAKGIQDIASSAPWIDVMSMCHEQAEVRLFMS